MNDPRRLTVGSSVSGRGDRDERVTNMIRHDQPAHKRETSTDHTFAAGECPQSRNTFTPHHVAKVANWLRLLIDPDQVVELRALGMNDVPRLTLPDGTEREPVYAGCFRGSELETMAREALLLSGRCRGVYYTLNPLRPERFARQAPRMQQASGSRLAHDAHVARRTRLLIDVDPVKAADGKDRPASEAEHAAALEHAGLIRDCLTAHGWPEPVALDTGNGGALVYRIDLAPESNLVRSVLHGLATFDGPAGRVDVSVHNPSRIARLPGPLNAKGQPTADRPHRRCVVLGEPDRLAVVPDELLLQVADLVPKPKPVATISTARTRRKTAGGGDVIERARRYLATIPGAVSRQGGHNRTFYVACVLVIRFDLTPDQAFPLLAEWNQKCDPPWSEYDLRRKLAEADKQPGPRGEKLNAERAEPTSAPAVAVDPPTPVDLSAWERGKAGQYCSTCDNFACEKPKPFGRCDHVPDYMLGKAGSVSKALQNKVGTLSSTEEKVEEQSVPADLLNKLIGQPDGNYCPHACRAGLEGYSAKSAYSAVVLLRCRCWSKCAACREYDRYLAKNDNLPVVARLATHIFTGTADEWESIRTRLAKLKVKVATFAISDGNKRTTIIAADPTSAPIPDTLTNIRPVSRVEAVVAAATAIDALPDKLPKGVRKFSPSHTWKLLVEHGTWKAIRPVVEQAKAEAVELKAMTPEDRQEHKQTVKQAEEQKKLERGGIVWRRLDEVPLLSPDDVAKLLDQHDIEDYSRQSLAGNNVMDSVMWELPVEPEKIEAIRRAIYEVNVVLPASMGHLWEPSPDPIPY
jgi:hypothetical protein